MSFNGELIMDKGKSHPPSRGRDQSREEFLYSFGGRRSLRPLKRAKGEARERLLEQAAFDARRLGLKRAWL